MINDVHKSTWTAKALLLMLLTLTLCALVACGSQSGSSQSIRARS